MVLGLSGADGNCGLIPHRRSRTVAVPKVTASHQHSSGHAAALPVRETGQQWAMLKLFGAAATFGVVLR
jgi:hypothetical protein